MSQSDIKTAIDRDRQTVRNKEDQKLHDRMARALVIAAALVKKNTMSHSDVAILATAIFDKMIDL